MDRSRGAFVFGLKVVRDKRLFFVGEATIVHELIFCVRFIIYLYDKKQHFNKTAGGVLR